MGTSGAGWGQGGDRLGTGGDTAGTGEDRVGISWDRVGTGEDRVAAPSTLMLSPAHWHLPKAGARRLHARNQAGQSDLGDVPRSVPGHTHREVCVAHVGLAQAVLCAPALCMDTPPTPLKPQVWDSCCFLGIWL